LVERSAPLARNPDALDLPVLSVPELRVLERCVLGQQSEADTTITETTICPKLCRTKCLDR
jgi:hypothetical protein